MRIGIVTAHSGFGLKEERLTHRHAAGHEVVDFGAHSLNPSDDYPNFVIPLARAVAAGVPGFIGFAVGHTAFWEPLVGWRDRKTWREATVAEIARR
jgi:ribose 5-phosphate isomerase RpiB